MEIIESLLGASVYIESIPDVPKQHRRDMERDVTRHMIERVFGNDACLCHNSTGAPYIDGREECISISHSRKFCAIAVRTGGSVGVDVEEWRQQLKRVANKFLTPEERERYGHSEPALLKCWTAKEATFKTAGRENLTISGITVDIDRGTASIDAPYEKFSVRFIDRYPVLIALVTPA